MSDQPTPYPQDGIPIQPDAYPQRGPKSQGWNPPYREPEQRSAITIGLKEILLAMGGVVVTISISVASWFFGNIHARLDKHEARIQTVEKDDVNHQNDIESLQTQSVRQWELMRKQGEAISDLKAKVNRPN